MAKPVTPIDLNKRDKRNRKMLKRIDKQITRVDRAIMKLNQISQKLQTVRGIYKPDEKKAAA